MDEQPGRDPAVERGDRCHGRYHLETWGCQMNVHDSQKLAGALEELGLRRAEVPRDADVILLNTCSIREKATEKIFSELGRLRPLKRRNPRLILGVCGCVAQLEGQRLFERAPQVDFVVGPRATRSIPELVLRLLAGDETARHSVDLAQRDDSVRFPFDRIRRDLPGSGKQYVTVIEGCNHRCSYCVVPATRGREVSRDMDEILREVRDLAERGVREVEFLGQTVNAYRDDSRRTLADLLLAAARIDGLARIRFTTSHPAQMTAPLMDAMAAAAPKTCPFLHLPAQSGSSAVLRAMRRGYDRAAYLRCVEQMRKRMPDIRFGTDIIVGYPAEGEEEFRDTLGLLDEVEFDTVYSFAYSPRPRTSALAGGDPVPLEEKLERLRRVQSRQKSIQERRNRLWIGSEVEVLVEEPSERDAAEWSGRSPENRVVNFRGSAVPGQIVRVKIDRVSAYSMHGESAFRPA